MTIDFNKLSKEMGATPKRVATIYSKLFGELAVTSDQAAPHIAAVIEKIKSQNLTLAMAVDAYKLEVVKSQQQHHQTASTASATAGKGSVSALLESDRSATRKLSQKRYAAIVRESNELLAEWLTNGLPEDELNDELENAIFDSDDLVLDALTEAIDSTGTYAYPKALIGSPSNQIAALLLPSQTAHTNGKK